MNDQCLCCTVRKICDLEEPEEDWTCMCQDGHAPCEWEEGVRIPKGSFDINVLVELLGVLEKMRSIKAELKRKGIEEPKGFSVLEGYVIDRIAEMGGKDDQD